MAGQTVVERLSGAGVSHVRLVAWHRQWVGEGTLARRLRGIKRVTGDRGLSGQGTCELFTYMGRQLGVKDNINKEDTETKDGRKEIGLRPTRNVCKKSDALG